MDFDYSPRTRELQARLTQFMDEHVYPAEKELAAELAANTTAGKRWTPLKTIENLKPKAQAAGLWNLFLPVDTAEASGYHGAGLTNQEYAPLAEIMGRVLGQRGLQLLGARHRQHGNHRPLRQRSHQGRMADPSARRTHPLGLRHDRARSGIQ